MQPKIYRWQIFRIIRRKMSCPTVESKPLPSAVSVPKELTINGSAGKMSYPYKKRVRDAFERHQQQEQQQQQDPQRRLQPQQQYAQHHRQQGKKQPKHMLQLEASGTAIAASGNIPGLLLDCDWEMLHYWQQIGSHSEEGDWFLCMD